MACVSPLGVSFSLENLIACSFHSGHQSDQSSRVQPRLTSFCLNNAGSGAIDNLSAGKCPRRCQKPGVLPGPPPATGPACICDRSPRRGGASVQPRQTGGGTSPGRFQRRSQWGGSKKKQGQQLLDWEACPGDGRGSGSAGWGSAWSLPVRGPSAGLPGPSVPAAPARTCLHGQGWGFDESAALP